MPASRPAAYCEARVMPAKCVCKLPDAISFETGAAMMLKGLTAQYLLKKTLPVEGLQPGDHVLFHAAAGGVGLIACQWAKVLGLQLIATAGTDAKCQLALANGAAHAINYATEDFAARVKEITAGQGVKVVYDSVGKPESANPPSGSPENPPRSRASAGPPRCPRRRPGCWTAQSKTAFAPGARAACQTMNRLATTPMPVNNQRCQPPRRPGTRTPHRCCAPARC
jgi:threonine dehydrogenase-like Zn-dependent dehydrogenase